MNIESWQHNPFILDNYSQRDVLSIMSALDSIRRADEVFSSITVNVRQFALGRS